MSPCSLAELEKEVGNLRRGLRAVEVVSTSVPAFVGVLPMLPGTRPEGSSPPPPQTLSAASLCGGGDRTASTATTASSAE